MALHQSSCQRLWDKSVVRASRALLPVHFLMLQSTNINDREELVGGAFSSPSSCTWAGLSAVTLDSRVLWDHYNVP